MRLVVLVGCKGAGKSTAAAALIEDGFIPMSFADALKDALAALFGWPRDMLQGDTPESRLWREQVDPWWSERLAVPGFTPRMALTRFGTEVVRQNFHRDMWVHAVARRIDLLPPGRDVVLIDGRFPNEIALGRRRGGLVLGIQKGAWPDWHGVAIAANNGDAAAAERMRAEFDVHESEYAWIGQRLDGVIHNDGSIADLQARLRARIRSNHDFDG